MHNYFDDAGFVKKKKKRIKALLTLSRESQHRPLDKLQMQRQFLWCSLIFFVIKLAEIILKKKKTLKTFWFFFNAFYQCTGVPFSQQNRSGLIRRFRSV